MVTPFEFRQIAKPLETIWKKQIATASSRKRPLLRLARYEIKLEHIRGKENSIAEALSPVEPLSPERQDRKQMNAIPVHQVTPLQQQTIALTEPELPPMQIQL